MNTTIPSTIDLRQIPPLQRHGSIFERLAALDARDALLLVNDHDPAPLRRQWHTQWPGQFGYAHLESGPDLCGSRFAEQRPLQRPAQARAVRVVPAAADPLGV